MVFTMPSTAATMPNPGSASATFCTAMRGLVGFLVMVLQLLLEQALELVRVEVAADHQAQAVGDEFMQVMVVAHLRIVLEERAAVRGVEIGLDRHQAFLADLHERRTETSAA